MLCAQAPAAVTEIDTTDAPNQEMIMCTQAITIQTVDERSGLLWWAREVVCLLVLSRALRKARAELHDLDDRMLEDIGIKRSEIDRALQTPVRWDNMWSLLWPETRVGRAKIGEDSVVPRSLDSH